MLMAPGVKDWQQIIGVVADVRNNGLNKPVKPAIYLPFSAFMMRYVEILVKSRIDPQILIHSVRQQIATVDADQQIYGRTDNIETWIHDQPEWGRALADFDSLCDLRWPGVGVIVHWFVQRGFLLRGPAHQRVWNSDCAGSKEERCAQERAERCKYRGGIWGGGWAVA